MHFNASVTDVARNFADYVNRVAFRGERFILMKGKRAVAELRPVAGGVRARDFPNLMASIPHLTPEELHDFAADIETARRELDAIPLRDPWAS
jgi:antitoxin (DNA-binding transcriptional repressor) of toxin-antitoxin stability system